MSFVTFDPNVNPHLTVVEFSSDGRLNLYLKICRTMQKMINFIITEKGTIGKRDNVALLYID